MYDQKKLKEEEKEEEGRGKKNVREKDKTNDNYTIYYTILLHSICKEKFE
jgi:hypothetical protein